MSDASAVEVKRLVTPLDDATVADLRAGDAVTISGVIYGARDAAHQRMVVALDRGEALPFDPEGQIIYYVGPAPAKPGQAVGSAGPTTSGRMDRYAPRLHAAGVRGTIGKGYRSKAVREALVEHRAVYFAALGGSGALLARCIVAAEVIAYPELGPEAVYRFVVEEFPVVVVNDMHGNDLYEQSRTAYQDSAGQTG